MASLPSPTQVSGKHNAIYEAYYKQVDPKGLGTIEAMDAAKFLKKSGLSDVVLSRIWDLSDPKGRGCLDKTGFFVSLKLVALAQAGSDINMRNILQEMANPPKVGELPKIIPQTIQSVAPTTGDWSIKPADRANYEKLFESLTPVNGMIAGNKVKGVLMDSKLPLETLGKIWDLADQDKDGNLDKHEFIVAMHLVYQTLQKRVVPSSLPPELQKPKSGGPPTSVTPENEGFGDGGFVANFPTDIAPPPVPPLPAVMTASARMTPVPMAIPSVPLIPTDPIVPLAAVPSAMGAPGMAAPYDWIVTPSDRVRYETIFRDSDKDKDGLVSGLEVKNVFLQSGVPQNCLAHIWALCDTNQSGKLTVEQFALAMYFVEQKKKGFEPPEALAPNMIPPSLRGSAGIEPTIVAQETKPTYSNPELEMISKEIDELARERRLLETDIAQKEADIRIKSGEVRSLQSELDTLAATLKQLENQKGEAQKRLDDLKAQKVDIDDALASFNVQIETTRQQVNKIREQCQKQEATINEQEEELNSKKSELQKLKDEESALEKEYDANRRELDNLTKQLQDTQLQISQVKAMVTQLLETQRQMNDALLLCRAAIEANDAVLVSDYSLKIEPDFTEARQALVVKQADQPKPGDGNGFGSSDAFGHNTNGFGTSDPFASSNGNRAASGFDDSFSNAPLPGGFDDAFGGSSAFGASQTRDPFAAGAGAADPFGDKTGKSVTPEPGKDDFGSDPFAILHAPTGAGQVLSPSMGHKSGPPPRPESPSPALPPKKSKQPPPRPAPPRPLQGPPRPAQPAMDNFGSSGGFTDFADFDKLPNIASSASNSSIPSVFTINSSPFGSSVTPSPLQGSTKSTQSDTNQSSSASQSTVGGGGGAPFTDFAEDPFKDYRYEDPFNIKDPFDDDDGEKSSEDVFSDASTKDYTRMTNLKTSTTTTTTDSALRKTPSPFDITVNSGRNTTANSSSLFSQTTQLTTQENFALFDTFDNDTTTSSLGKDNNNRNNDFFDAFNDNFKTVDRKNLNTKPQNTFDPFGTAIGTATTTVTTKSAKIFDAFNDNFDDDFYDASSTTPPKTATATDAFKMSAVDDRSNGNFASFDDFGDAFGAASTTALNNSKASATAKLDASFKQNNLKSKVTNNNDTAASTKMPDRFAEDYSKGDTFEDDLKRVLQLSLVDQ